ncbi:unnamed protein product [Urochloa humidicola]
MRPALRGGGAAPAGASARALILLLLLLLVLLIGGRGADAIRAVPRGGKARNHRSHGHGHGARAAAMPLPGTRPVPARMAPATGSAEEESKRRIPSCPDPLHNR